MAEPFVHEGANAKPQQPTVKWLMAQLGKYGKNGIGTGATRTSTVAEITKKPSSSAKFKSQILEEKRGKLSFADCGQMSYMMLKGTHIADLAITEHVEEEMRLVADGKLSEADGLHEIQAWIRDDIRTMTDNAKTMRTTMGLTDQSAPAERVSGVWNGQNVSFKREFSGHRFTDDEVSRLLAGESIKLMDCVSAKTGRPFKCEGKLEQSTFKGRTFVGFKPVSFLGDDGKPVQQRDSSDYVEGTWKRKKVRFKRIWGGHRFTDDEVADLLAGKEITLTGLRSKSGTEYGVTGKLANLKYNGVSYVGFDKTGFVGADGKVSSGGGANSADYVEGDWQGRHVRFKRVFRGKKLTAAQVKSLLAGKEVTISGLTSKAGKTYNCLVRLADLEYNGHKYVGLEQVGYA
jgi:DNA topoisomerase-3